MAKKTKRQNIVVLFNSYDNYDFDATNADIMEYNDEPISDKIELDDNTHNQAKRIERDDFVNKLFKDLEIKLLRIPVQNYYNIEELKNKIKESL